MINFIRHFFSKNIDFTIYLEEDAIYFEPKISRRYANANIFYQEDYETTVTHEMIEKIKAIPTNESRGYTHDFIESVIRALHDNLGKAMLVLTNNHHFEDDDFNKRMVRAVKLMNKKEIDFSEAAKIVARTEWAVKNLTSN